MARFGAPSHGRGRLTIGAAELRPSLEALGVPPDRRANKLGQSPAISMPPSQEDFWLGGLILSLAAASLATWYVLLGRMRRGPILAYERRRPVPWNGAAALLGVGFVVIAVLATVFAGDGGGTKESAKESDASSHEDAVREIGLNIVWDFAVVGGVLAAVVAVSGATKVDLGLPKDVGGLVRDVKIGIVAWLAALAPVYGTQIMLVLMFGEPPQHPLVQMVAKDQDGLILFAAFVAAVVAAPICEEITFRLLLQGWLEKWEDRRLGWRKAEVGEAVPEVERSAAAAGAHEETLIQTSESPSLLPAPISTVDTPIHGLLGLPHGWLPILVSSLLFALAHFGIGPDPIPLFFLAIVLGYTYQRTHRIVPCMVTHALFNSLTLIALWRMLSTGEPVPP
jgi:membrane protease YdiL (CAAX protease family)